MLPAETGRPETGKEFAARTKRHFVLKGPKDRKEGEDIHETPEKLVIRLPAHKGHTELQPSVNQPNNPKIEHLLDKEISSKSQSIDELIHTNESPPSLIDIVNGGQEPIDLLSSLKGNYGQDPLFSKVVQNPKEFKNFDIANEVLYLKLPDRKVLCLPSIMVGTRNIREIVISNAHSLLAHLGSKKTLTYLRDHVWWKEMVGDVQSYCDSCTTCRHSKPSNHKPYGLLNPLPVPSQPWDAIGIDFVGPLPLSKDRDATYDSITVIIDLLTAMVHIVPSRTDYTARNVAELVFSEVYKHHGLPKAIISDRDSLFTSIFWKHLQELIGTKLKMSSAYHPETDGSTERANRTITQMIRQCISPTQKDWVARLPAIEFAINSARSDSTGYARFFLNTGRMPRSFIWNTADKSEYPGVRVFAQRLKSAIMAAHDSILAAQVKQTRTANRRRQMAPFTEGELVYISSKNISFPKGLTRKFLPKYIGPYLILKDFGNNSYRIQIPARLRQRGIHDVFHASLLRIHVPNDDRLFPGRLETQIGEVDNLEGEWAADKITSHSGSKMDALFEVLWRSGDVSWMTYHQVAELSLLGSYFEALGIDNIQGLITGTGVPPDNDPQVSLMHLELEIGDYNISEGIELTLYPHLDSFPPTATNTHTNVLAILLHTISPAIPTIFPNLRRSGPMTFTLQYTEGLERTLHPLQLRSYVDYDRHLREGKFDAPEPIGYHEFAEAVNTSGASKPHRFVTYDPLNHLWVPNGPPVNPTILPIPFHDPDAPIRHPGLDALGLLTPSGRIVDSTIQMLKAAIMEPHRRQRHVARMVEKRMEAKAGKRKHVDEPESGVDYSLPLNQGVPFNGRETPLPAFQLDPLPRELETEAESSRSSEHSFDMMGLERTREP